MVVYGEYLFLENFITGLLLLYFTWKLTEGPGDSPPASGRLAAGAVLCGGSGFLLFLNSGSAYGMIGIQVLRAMTAFLICAVVFGQQNLLKNTFLFLIISFLSGGIAMAVFFWMEIPALAGNGVLYLESMTWIKLFLCGTPAMAFAAWFIKIIRRKRSVEFAMGMAELELGPYRCSFRSCVDSGNGLREPCSRSAVILIDKKGASQLPFRKEDYPQRFAVIPYQAVGVEQGVLEGIRLDRVRFESRTLDHVILAYYEGHFKGFEVLLHRDIIEGGLLDYEEIHS